MFFTKKEQPDIEIKEIFPNLYKEMVEDPDFINLEVDPAFGQQWQLANLTMSDVYQIGNSFHKKIIKSKEMLDSCEEFYKLLKKFNPDLKNITATDPDRMLDIICGVGSGLHYNDIKYFVEDLKGSAKNELNENAELWKEAFAAYMKRSGYDFEIISDEDAEKIMQTEEYFNVDNKISFVFSPETCRRIIDNEPYNKK